MDVRPIPGLEHLPFAEVWIREPGEATWRDASDAARAIGKDALEVWTTDETPEVAGFLLARGFANVRSYVVSELDVATAPEPDAPALEVRALADRPVEAAVLYAIALESYPDQPGRADTRLPAIDGWRAFGLDPHPPEAFMVARDGDTVAGYGYVTPEDGVWTHGFTGVARGYRGRGVGGAIKRAQIAWAKTNGISVLRTATEVRLEQMRALNERFGYHPLHTELVLRGPLYLA
jgi:GNAT superfamily N-acetyltransferase